MHPVGRVQFTTATKAVLFKFMSSFWEIYFIVLHISNINTLNQPYLKSWTSWIYHLINSLMVKHFTFFLISAWNEYYKYYVWVNKVAQQEKAYAAQVWWPKFNCQTHKRIDVEKQDRNNKLYLEKRQNVYLSEGMSLAIWCFTPDPFLIVSCLVSPWARPFSTAGTDKSPGAPWNWGCSCSFAFFSWGASSFRSPRGTFWSGCCSVLDPLL